MLFNIQTVLERPQKSYSGWDSAQTMLGSSSPQLVDYRTTTLSLSGLNSYFSSNNNNSKYLCGPHPYYQFITE